MYSKENVENIINRFVDSIKQDINVEQVYLFGSYAKGTQDQYSDIDLAVVSNDFEGVRFFDRKKLFKYLIKVNTDIELHTFKTEDFTNDDPLVAEIIKTGIRFN
ncbi:MAG: nucleotidyltransferase domain-containing protein [Ignavibacteria bacterium]|nr:nucleotidyltransferase domain-containing protein [Ignavibacteria bacterium]